MEEWHPPQHTPPFVLEVFISVPRLTHLAYNRWHACSLKKHSCRPLSIAKETLFELSEGSLATATKTCHSLFPLESPWFWFCYEFCCPRHKDLTLILFKGGKHTLAGGRNAAQAMPSFAPKTFPSASLEQDEPQCAPVLNIFTFFFFYKGFSFCSSYWCEKARLSNTSEGVTSLFVTTQGTLYDLPIYFSREGVCLDIPGSELLLTQLCSVLTAKSHLRESYKLMALFLSLSHLPPLIKHLED